MQAIADGTLIPLTKGPKMTKRNSLTAALAALSLLWVFALPAAAVDPTEAGEAGLGSGGRLRVGPHWSTPCTDTGRGGPAVKYLTEDEGVYSIVTDVTSIWEENSGTLYLCGNLTDSDSGGDDVHSALGAACHAAGYDRYWGDDGRGQMIFPGRAVVQISNLRWAPSLTGVFAVITADYATLPEGPDSSTGTFVMQLDITHSLFIGSSCTQQSTGGMPSFDLIYSPWELIPTS